MKAMNGTQDIVTREFVKEDEDAVKQLVEKVFTDFLSGKYWDWKYKRNPNFDPSLLMIAQKNDKVVGCNHWLRRNLKISDSISIQAVLGADLIVDPEYRGHGIGKSLMLFARSRVYKIVKDGAVMRYMFAEPDLSKRLYTPVAGYIPAPTQTISYFKILNWSKLLNRIEIINEKIKNERVHIEKADLKVLFRLAGAPHLFLELGKDGIKAAQTSDARADIVLTTDLSILAQIKGKKKRVRAMIWAVLTRKLKIRGGLFSLVKFYQNLWLVEEIFSEKVS
jgi:predicted N-acetyltransferase YhbS/putative sterol carrier protein